MSYSAKWKVLEDLMIDLRKRSANVPINILDDLRSAKLMIKISESQGGKEDAEQKVEEYLGSVESSLINEALKTLSAESVDQWLRRLEAANAQSSQKKMEENAFVTGVPRDQKWVRVEPHGNLTAERIKQMVKENNLSVNEQTDARLVVYGQSEDIKIFLKKMTAETNKNNSS